jgi:hypothetical protein
LYFHLNGNLIFYVDIFINNFMVIVLLRQVEMSDDEISPALLPDILELPQASELMGNPHKSTRLYWFKAQAQLVPVL